METQTEQKPKKVIFKPIDLTKAIQKAKKTPKVKKEVKAGNIIVEGSLNLEGISEVSAQDNSIQEFINHCHPDVRTFIRTNEIKCARAEAGCLIITTKNKFRVVIKSMTSRRKFVHIRDNKGNTYFKGNTDCIINKN